MNIQIFGKSKSFDTKKAERWFKERRIKYQYIDLVSKGVSPGGGGKAAGIPGAVRRTHCPQREAGHRGLLPGDMADVGIGIRALIRAPQAHGFFRAAPRLSLCGVALSPCSCAPP